MWKIKAKSNPRIKHFTFYIHKIPCLKIIYRAKLIMYVC